MTVTLTSTICFICAAPLIMDGVAIMALLAATVYVLLLLAMDRTES